MSGIQFNGFALAIDQIKSLALWSKLWSKPNEVIPQTKNPTISNMKSLDLWSEWRESNSRPLEPHSSALPKLRYTRISRSASLPKRGDKRYYTQIGGICQPFFAIFSGIFAKSPIFTHRRSFYCCAACRSALSFSSRGLRYWPVKLPGTSATCSGVPSAMTRPPALPPSGPRSMT